MTTRLLQIVPSLEYTGAHKQMLLLSSRLPRHGFDVRVFSLGGDGPLANQLRQSRVPMNRIDRLHNGLRRSIGPLSKSIREFSPQIVHTWETSANICGRAAAIRADVPHIVASHRSIPNRRSFLDRLSDRFLTRWTQRYVVSTQHVLDAYLKQGLPAEKMTIIQNGVEDTQQSVMSRRQFLDSLNLAADAKLIGAIGPLDAEKRIKDLIWAADLLKVIRDDVYLLIIGEGPNSWRLKRFRDQVCIQDRVLFLGTRNDLSDWIGHLDCVWLANHRNALCNSLLEAMSAGVPVVATNTPGNREAVVPGQTGYLVPIGDRGAIARQTQRLLENRELAQQLGTAGQSRARDRFHVDNMVQSYVHMYRQLVDA